MAGVAVAEGRFSLASILMAAAQRQGFAIGAATPPQNRFWNETILTKVHQALDKDSFNSAWEAGQIIWFDELIKLLD